MTDMKALQEKVIKALEKQVEVLSEGRVTNSEHMNAPRAIDSLTRLLASIKQRDGQIDFSGSLDQPGQSIQEAYGMPTKGEGGFTQ